MKRTAATLATKSFWSREEHDRRQAAGCGMPVLGGRFTGTPELGLGLSERGRDWRLGWRLGLAGSGPVAFDHGGVHCRGPRLARRAAVASVALLLTCASLLAIATQAQALAADLTARFEAVPVEHDGSSPFTVRLAFSAPVASSYVTLRDVAVTATGGTVTGARRVGGSALWELTVQPSGVGAVAVTVAASAACGAPGAVCTSDGRALANAPSVTVPGPPVGVPLTVSFANVPPAHDGSSSFTVRLAFSAPVAVSYVTLRDVAVTATGGTVTGARRVGGSALWELTVQPSGAGAVTVTLAASASCDEAHAICTSDGRALSQDVSETVQGPVSLASEVSISTGGGTTTTSETPGANSMTEGSDVVFTVTRTGSLNDALTVNVTVSETGAMLKGTPAATVTFAANSSTAELRVETEDDEVMEPASVVTAAIAAGSGYSVDTGAASAGVTVEDDDAAPPHNTSPTGKPAISGAARVGEPLTASSAGIADADGLADATFAWQWIANDGTSDAEIAGASSATYTLTSAEVGKTLKVRVTFTDDQGHEERLVSEATAPVAAALPVLADASVADTLLTLSFDKALDEGSVPPAGAFAVLVGGTARGVSSVAVSASAVTLTLASRVVSGETVTVSYAVPTGANASPLQDAAGNPAAGFSNRAVTNNTPSETLVGIYSLSRDWSEDASTNFRVRLVRFGDASEELTVNVSVTETGSMLVETPPSSFTFAAGEDEVDLEPIRSSLIEDDLVDEPDSEVTIAILEGAGYRTSDALWGGPSLAITVNDDDWSPEIMTQSPVLVAENRTAVATLTAKVRYSLNANPDLQELLGQLQSMGRLTWSLAGGADSDKFTLSTDGELAFETAKDFEAPDDADTDGDYEIEVRVTDGHNSTDAGLTIRLTDVSNTATGKPAISGAVPQVGNALTATKGTIDDDDGVPATFTYQWVRVDGSSERDIAGATASAYTLSAADVGRQVKVKVSFTDNDGNAEGPLAGDAWPPAGSVVAAKRACPSDADWCAEMTLSADVRDSRSQGSGNYSGTFSYSSADGRGSLSDDTASHEGIDYTITRIGRTLDISDAYSYRYDGMMIGVGGTELPDGTVFTIAGAALTVGAASGQTGLEESWDVTGLSLPVWFEGQQVTVSLKFPANSPPSGQPTISGTAEVGETLTASASGIADADGLTNAVFAWQWIANDGTSDADISGATDATYTLTAAEVGKTLKVRVTFTDDGGTEETLVSEATGTIIDDSAPTLIWTPTLTIEARHGWRGYSALAIPDLGAVSESSFAYGSGAPYPLLNLGANANGVIFQVPSRGEESLSELILEWGGATLPLSAAVRVGSTFTWGQTWLDANAASLNASAYATTLPNGGAGTVCLRTSDQTCPSTSITPPPTPTPPTPTPPAPTMSVFDATATEGVAMEFTVSLSAWSDQQVTVEYATSSGTATSGTDFTAASDTLTFGANETSKTVSVATTDDSVHEQDETFTLELSSPTNATLGDAMATGTINDDDEMVTVSDTLLTLVEGGGSKAYTVKLNAPPDGDVTVRIKAIDRNGRELSIGSGGLRTSLTVSSEYLTFATSNWNVPQTVTLRDEHDERETHEVIRMTHTASGGGYDAVAIPDVTVKTWDDDWTPVFVYKLRNPKRLPEGAQGYYLVRLNGRPGGYGPEGGVTTVTIGGWEGTDVTVSPSTFTFTQASFNFPQRAYYSIAHDPDDANETVTLTHRASGGGYDVDYDGNPIAVETKTIRIADDENPSTQFVSIAPPQGSVTEGNAVVFTLTRTGDVTAALTVGGSVSETGEMLTGTPNPWSVTFSAGSTTAELSFPTDDDEVAEDESDITTMVYPGYDYTYASNQNTATVTVEDDDAAPVITSTGPLSADENGTAIATLTATDDNTPVADLVWSLAGGADADKVTLSAVGVLAFKAAKDFEAPDDADGDGDYEIDVRVTDGVNPVHASLTVSLADVDGDVAPTLESALVAGSLLTLGFSGALDGGSTPGPDAFVVKTDGASHVEAISSVSVSGSTVFLALSYPVSEYGTSVTVSYTVPTGANASPLQDAAGNQVAGFSDEAVTNTTASSNAAPTGLPTISGLPVAGETLTASASDIADADGMANATFAWQWIANDGTSDADIAGATGSTYTLTAADAGKTIMVRATFTDDKGTEETLVSEATVAVAESASSMSLQHAYVSGSWLDLVFSKGSSQRLDANSSPAAAAFAVEVNGAVRTVSEVSLVALNGVRLTLTPAVTGGDVVLVGYTAPTGVNANRLQDNTGLPVASFARVAVTNRMPAPDNNLPTGVPTISGTATVGETLTASASGIADADGMTNATFAWQWIATDTDIAVATGSTYTLSAADVGKGFKVRVSFTDDGGKWESLVSRQTSIVLPVGGLYARVSGSPGVGELLTAILVGGPLIFNAQPSQFAFQWISSDGANDFDIAGATEGDYRPTAADVGKAIKVRVTFTDNEETETTYVSAPTAAIKPALTLGLEDVPAGHDGFSRFEVNLRFSDHVYVRGVTHRLEFGGSNPPNWGVVSHDPKRTPNGDTARDFTVWITPRHTDDIEFHFDVWSGTCFATKDICTEDKQRFREATSTTIPGPSLGVMTRSPITAPENTTAIATLTAESGDTPAADLVWSLAGGADADEVTLSSDGVLAFKAAKDFEAPDDSDYDGDYAITVRVSDGGDTADKPLTIRLANIDEDEVAPDLMGATVDGSALTLNFHEPLDGSSVPALSAFTVKVDGAAGAVSGISIDGYRVRLTLASSVSAGKTLTVGYAIPTGADASPLQDVGGNQVASFADQSVANESSAPTVWGSPKVEHNQLELYFSEELDEGSVPPKAAFTVRVDGSPRTVYGVAIDGRKVTLNMIMAAQSSATWTVGYTVPTGANASPLQDPGGNQVASFADRAVLNNAVPNDLTVERAEVAGSSLTLRFTSLLLASSEPAPSAFAVTVNGTTRGVSSVSIGVADLPYRSEVTLTLASPVTYGDTVTVGYAVPVGANASPLRSSLDSAILVASFAGVAVTNRTVSPMTLQDAHVVGNKLNLVFSRVSGQGLDQNSLPEPAAFAVGASGTARDVSEVSFQGQHEVVLTLTSPVAPGDSVRVGYTVPTRANAKRLQDNAGLPVAAFAGLVVTNRTPTTGAPTGLPTISGTAQVGATLTASASAIADADGLGNATFAWQWIGNDGTSDADIAGATAETYTLTAAEAGKTVKVRVTFTDDGGTEETLVSDATAAVEAALPVVSIAASSSPVTEGTAASFTLYRTGDTAAELTVSVAVTEAGSVLDGTPPSTVTFAAGGAEATLGVATGDDGVAEADARVTASVSAGSGYQVDADAGSARVDVFDNDAVVAASVRTLWTSTIEWQGDYGNGWVNAQAEDFSSPGWSENGNACRIGYFAYGSASRQLWLRVSSDLCVGGIPDPETLTLHVGDVTVEAGDAVTAFASGRIGIVRNVEQDWTVGELVQVRLTRTEAGEAVGAGPGLSVDDAQVLEAEGAELTFRVTLDEVQTSAVSVRYATSDGTARAGSDYVARAGALRFAPGETAKTVTVPVLNDAHDEGSETLTLALSSPFGAALADGEATGTIMNTDPMPKAWITRFGRTVGSQVVDAVTARFENGGGSHVTVGGVSLGGSGSPPAEISAWNEWDTGRERSHGSREISERELLLGSSFHLSSGERTDGGSAFTAWGRVASDGFEADADDADIDGDVTTAFLGFDAEWDRALAGLLLSQSSGDGSYVLDTESGNDRGKVESALTGVYPYARLAMSDRVSVWGVAGIGGGELTLHQEGGTPADTDLAMRMGAVGVKGTLLDGADRSGIGVSVKSDAMWVRTEADRAEEFESADGEVTRLRLVLEGERAFATGDGATFTPSGRVGLRHDGGDAETGIGVEMGAGIRYTAGALTVEGNVRALVAHEASGYEEWGASGAMRLRPDSSGRGLTLTLAPTWGSAASATERLWSGRDVTSALALGDEAEAEGSLEATIGYGMPVLGGRFTGTPELGLGLSERGRDWRLGWRLGLAGSGPVAFDLGVEATRREPADGDAPENRFALTATMRW